ncbi:antitoxin MazE family protein [Geomonas sp. RF6]|uniref:antitoxin MazE family protein n=1 Tax=Geomonas sp. RF6 TaxID=2897342 RepID=UPI003FA5E025
MPTGSVLHVTQNGGSTMQPTRHRVQTHRERLRSAGLKPVQIWIPDPLAPGFAAECRRQSLIIRNDPAEAHDIDLLAEIADWGNE